VNTQTQKFDQKFSSSARGLISAIAFFLILTTFCSFALFFSGNACFRIFRAENASLSAPVMKSGAGGATVSLSITRAQDCQIFLG
jgi:hypothetical protein